MNLIKSIRPSEAEVVNCSSNSRHGGEDWGSLKDRHNDYVMRMGGQDITNAM